MPSAGSTLTAQQGERANPNASSFREDAPTRFAHDVCAAQQVHHRHASAPVADPLQGLRGGWKEGMVGLTRGVESCVRLLLRVDSALACHEVRTDPAGRRKEWLAMPSTGAIPTTQQRPHDSKGNRLSRDATGET